MEIDDVGGEVELARSYRGIDWQVSVWRAWRRHDGELQYQSFRVGNPTTDIWSTDLLLESIYEPQGLLLAACGLLRFSSAALKLLGQVCRNSTIVLNYTKF